MSENGSIKSPAKRPLKGAVWPAAYLLLFFIAAGVVFWTLQGQISIFILLGTIGVFIGLGIMLHGSLRPKQKKWAHRLSLFTVGMGLFLGAGLFGRQNLQIEGFWFNVFEGVMAAGLVHYLVAKVVGPLFIGRAWCGWGCWTWAALNLLPFKNATQKKISAPYSWVRILFFFFSLGIVAFLYFGRGYRPGNDWKTTQALLWFIGGNAIYYVSGIIMAFIYKDNRAFCKILCPITAILKITTRVSFLKIGATSVSCNDCGACRLKCPMAIDIPGYILDGRRVLSSECTLCRECVGVCARGSIDMTLGFDLTTKDRFSIPSRPDRP
jgi:ferredoxin-type protein NapH